MRSRICYWMICYDAACIHAALAKLALQDQGKPPAERQRLAQRDLERALELLDKTRATGEFKGTIPLDESGENRSSTRSAPHPRFQLLMMDLAFPDDPFDAKPAPEPEAGNRTSPLLNPGRTPESPAPIAPSRGG